MKIYRILLLCFFTTLLIPLESEAQRDVYNWQITPYAGLLTIDKHIDFPKDVNTFAYGLRLERRLGNDFTLGLHFAQLDLGDVVQHNISGGFLSLAYHWDNGYFLSQRSFLSVFHRIDVGYADRYSTFESISGKSADFALGFENGLKFRLGDRISADLALEIFSSKASLTEGDITENIRYHVWKAGITYHFGSRKSKYVAPVFVPRTKIPAYLDKIHGKEESIWIVTDTVYNIEVKIDSVEIADLDSVMIPQLTRADSVLIFMQFDSLYQRRPVQDTLISFGDSTFVTTDSMAVMIIDSTAVDSLNVDSIPIQKYDSLKTSDSLVSPIDSSQYFLRTSDSLVSPTDSSQYLLKTPKSLFAPVDSSQYYLRSTDSIAAPVDSSQYYLRSTDSIVAPVDSSQYYLKSTDTIVAPVDTVRQVGKDAVIISADSLRTDTLQERKRSAVDAPVIVSPAITDTVIILKTDTVFEERPEPKNTDQKQKVDTLSQRNVIENGQGRVDTLYIVKDADESRQKSNEEVREVVTETTTTQTTSNQDARIASLEAEINRLKKENNRKNTGNVIAAGAAGTVLGAAVSKDKKAKKDTVYVDNTVDTTRIDSLQKELDGLRKVYGISDTLSVTDSYTPNPPIGMYFAENDSTYEFLPDSTYTMKTDSIRLKPDTLSTLQDHVLNEAIDDTDANTSGITDSTLPNGVAKPDTSSSETEVSAEEPKEPKKMTDSAPDLMGEYPVSCNFGLNKTSLEADELAKLDLVIDDLKNADNRKAVLTGYTDKSGNADYNLQLSKTRANAVRDHLVSKGIAASRIEINAGGVLTSADKYSLDARRVEVRVQ